MRLSSVSIESFRGFGREVRFDCSGEALILVGPNGYGKTSFFDAIVWCLFGDIPRLRGTRDSVGTDYIANAFGSVAPRVTVAFEHEGRVASLTRTRQGLVLVDHDGSDLSAERALQWIADLVGASLGARSYSVFDHSYLLGQEEIARFVRDLSPRDRFDALSDLLGADVVRRFYQRLESDLGIARENESEASRVLSQIDRSIESLRVEANSTLAVQASAAGEVRLRAELIRISGAATGIGVPTPQGLETQALAPLAQDLLAQVSARETRLTESIREARLLDGLSTQESDQRAEIERLDVARRSTLERLKPAETTTGALDHELAIVANELEHAEREANQDRTRARARRAFLRTALTYVTDATCPICGQPIEPAEVREQIETQLSDTPPRESASVVRLSSLRERLTALQAERDGAAASLQATKRELSDLGLKTRRLEALIQETEARQRDLRAEWDPDSRMDLRALVQSLDQRRTTAHVLRTQLEDVVNELAALAALARAKDVNSRLAESEERRVQLSSRAARTRSVVDLLDSLVRDAKDAEVETVRSVLSDHDPLLKALYTRLRPHPILDGIAVDFGKFKDRGEAYYAASEGSLNTNVAMTFSAAQQNAVAVCVFLAISLSRRGGTLDSVLLDDPIQNMDDYNVLGLMDLLRMITGFRQVVISTHDDQIGDLVRRKLRPLHPGGRTITHRFVAFDRAGPRLVTYVDEYAESADVLANAG